MADALYNKIKVDLLQGMWGVGSHVIGVYLVTASYGFDGTAHDYLADVPSQHIVARSTLASAAVGSTGTVDGDDTVFTSVTGSIITQIVAAFDTGNIATSPLLFKIDTATGLPLTPNGGNVTIAWDAGADKIFTL